MNTMCRLILMIFLFNLSACSVLECRVQEWKAQPLHEQIFGGDFSKCYGEQK